MAAPWTWIFQSTPGDWDLRRCLVEQPGLFWKVSAYKNDINIGDTVFMWESGSDAALLARCSVTSRPRKQPADPKYAPYVRHRKYLEEMVRARLRVDLVLTSPLKRRELIEHAVLADQLPIGGAPGARQGTNFNVHPTAASLLAELAAARS